MPPDRRFPRATLMLIVTPVLFSLAASLALAAPQSPFDGVAAKKAVYEAHALTHAGDARAGLALFFDRERTACVTCHRVNGEGGAVGPDLSRIGGKFDRPHLIESLLEPSRQIVEGFRASVVVTADGNVTTGVVTEESAQSVTIADVDAKHHVIPAARIVSRQVSPVSLMPDGLTDTLSPAELTDLVAYLETLRPGGKPKFGAGVVGPVKLRPGFEIETVATGLTGCTALETTPDGRVLICEQTGSLRVVRDGQLLEKPLLVVPVDRTWERGLIGVTVAPDFPETPHVYVCYVAAEPYPHHRISRFTADGDVAVPGSEEVLLEGDDQRQLGGNVPAGHQGGALHFGLDGKLYAAIGEQTAGKPAQDLESLLGKILRLDPDGSVPADNPFVDETRGTYRAIWARGCRNPFTFAIRDSDGLMLINDVGGKFEEINRGARGANFGWPVVDHGPTDDPRFRGPEHIYPQASISGGDFPPPGSSWPDDFRGRYFFADFVHGWIKTLDPERPKAARVFLSNLRRPVDLRFARDGDLWVLVRNAWVIDDKFEGGTGSLLRVRHTGGGRVQLTEDAVDESAGNLPSYRIETPTATYYLEKSGAGLSSMIDRDGNDWLGFHPKRGTGAGGEYRGFPNAVHKQSGSYFHARNSGTDPSTTTVEHVGPDRVTISAVSSNGLWACRYDFHPTHCTYTMTRMPPDRKFWVLYEGTPGGEYDAEDWWMTSASGERRPLTERHEGDIPAPEWIAFGDARLERALFLLHHEDDEHPDFFYQMQEKMTVFGFGRRGLEKYLDRVPQRFSIGFSEDGGHDAIGRTVERLR